VFQQNPCIVSDIPNPNHLLTLEIGMIDHLQQWIFHFMKTQEWLSKYNANLLSVPAHNVFTPQNKSYEEVPD
jgi:hypothetical protein